MYERNVLTVSLLMLAAAASLGAAPAAPSEPAPLPSYEVSVLPDNIAVTPVTQAQGQAKVFGQPREAKGHPCTVWDRDDINEYREKLKTDARLQDNLAKLKTALDARITKPLGVPEVKSTPSTRDDYHIHGANEVTMSDLGIAYALTGDENYGRYCKQMLLAYAANFQKYPHPAGWTEKSYRSALDGRLTGQFLEDGFWLLRVAFAYDLIHEMPGWTEAERTAVHDDLFAPLSGIFFAPILGTGPASYINADHNRAALCTAGVLAAGYACEDQKLIDIAMYGSGGSKEKPVGGVFGTHFTTKCILDDGLWVEGSPSYQTSIASAALFTDAEILWRHGVDAYSYRGGVLKRLLDSTLTLAYPDDKMTVAALHDAGQMILLGGKDWFTNELGLPYELGYERYQDSRYVPIIKNSAQTLSMTVHAGPPSRFLGVPSDSSAPARPIENANFYSVGFGVLRQQTPHGPTQLIMEYGPSAGHAHPSKLGIDLYALGDVLCPFPGVIFPYSDPMDPKWYWTTLGNCAVTVDQGPQIYSLNKWHFPKGLPDPEAKQLVYAPGNTLSLQRANSSTVYSGVTQDRAVFLTPEYLADVFGNFSETPHMYDMAWHFRGKLDSTLALQPAEFPTPITNGYNALTDVRRAESAEPWSATITTASNQTARLLSSGASGSEVWVGNGLFFTFNGKEQPPTVIERQAKQNDAIFENVVDLSSAGDVKAVSQTGSREKGFALLTIERQTGKDVCFVAYRPGPHEVESLQTDAMQAMVRTEGETVTAMSLAGGELLKTAGGSIHRNSPGLAVVEKTADGQYLVTNPSPADATIDLELPALAKLKVFTFDDQSQRVATPDLANEKGAVHLQIKAGAKVELAKE